MTTNLAIFVKNEALALVAMGADDDGGAVAQFDPRENVPTIVRFDDYFSVIGAFDSAVEVSKDNGWRLVHIGEPNVG